MKMIRRKQIHSVNDLELVDGLVYGSAWRKAYDVLYDQIWDEHTFLWHVVWGALHELSKELGYPVIDGAQPE